MGRIIGIDLGNRNVRAAVMEAGRPTVIPNEAGQSQTSALIAVDGLGRAFFGEEARRLAAQGAARTVDLLRRRLGTDETISVAGRNLTPTQLTAMLLARLKRDAEAWLGEGVEGAAITTPAAITQRQRKALLEAARQAGLGTVRLIDEAAAVAVARNYGREDGEKALFCSLGGGSCSMTFMETGDGVFEVVASTGDQRLGGADLDERLAEAAAATFRKENGVDLRGDPVAWRRLTQAAETARVELSERPVAQIVVPGIGGDALGARRLSATVSRETLETLSAEWTAKVARLAEQALSDAGEDYKPGRVVLCGGCARIPGVQAALRKAAGRIPMEIAEAYSAARGAAIYGGGLEGRFKDFLLLQASAHAVGVRLADGGLAPVIRKNSTFPLLRKQVFSTSADNQTSIDVFVLEETENGTEPVEQLRLGPIAPAPKGTARVELTMEMDLNGVVELSYQDVTSKPEPPPAREERVTPPQPRPATPGPAPGEAENNIRQSALREAVEAVLPTLDNLELAAAAAEKAPGGAAFAEGIRMTRRGLAESLERLGLKEIPALGRRFDPNLHHAVMQVPGGEKGIVLEVVKKGYTLNGRILRYAMVKVSE